MNGKKVLVVAGVVVLGIALFLTGATFAQSDEGGYDREWSEMMGGEGWDHGSMHAWDDHPEHGTECPEYANHADHADHADHMDGWDGWEEHHGAMHGAYGDMMGGWAQPEGVPDAPAEDSGE